jgi:beta-lactamase superfamily II metal-dependent hydrolase
MPQYRYAGYPDAKVVDDDEKEIQHVLWGDWVRVEDEPPQDGWLRVRVRGTDGWMRAEDLQDERLLEIVFVDVGQGDGCLVVTPKDRHMVVDAGLGDNMYRFLRWRYRGFKNVWRFESAVITHPDSDHYAGFQKLFEEPNVRFGTVYCNGILEEYDPDLGPTRKIGGRKHLTELLEDRAALEAFLGDTDRWQRQGGRYSKQYPRVLNEALSSGRVDDFGMLSTTPGGADWMPGYGPEKELSIRVLGPIVETHEGERTLRTFGPKPESKAFDVGKTKNGHSVVLMLQYRDFRVLLGGDLNRSAEAWLLRQHADVHHEWPWSAEQEDEIVAAARATFGADLVKSCHHGAADVTDAMLRSLNPVAAIVSSGDEESYAHPRPETLGAIGLHGRGHRPLIFSTELLRSTREDEGDARVQVERLRGRIDETENPERRAELEAELDALVDTLLERNVTTYGAINLRTDGRRAVLAYKLERPRTGGGRITKWDVYRLERAGNGPFAYVADD